MKILGGHDYYDGAGWGVDEKAVFVRSSETDPHIQHPFKLTKPIWRATHSFALSAGLAVVGDTLVPFWEKRRPAEEWRVNPSDLAYGERPFRMDVDYLYDTQDAIRAIDGMYAKRQQAKAISTIETHMAQSLTKTQIDWMINHQVTTIVLRTMRFDTKTGVSVAINEPTLKSIALYKVMDPATTHMTINAWISGVLPQTKPLVELTDKDRLSKAGFNQRSFRKDPETLS